MRAVALILALLVLASVPLAAADKSYSFTATRSLAVPGTLVLVEGDAPSGLRVPLPGSVATTWATNAPLNVSAPIHDGTVSFEGYFENVTSKPVTVQWGSVDGTGAFTQLASASCTMVSEGRTLVRTGVQIPTTGTALDVGHLLCVQRHVNGTLAAGHPAVRVTVPEANTLFPVANGFTAASNSSATIPLPELPALVLLGLGVAVVGAVAYRARR